MCSSLPTRPCPFGEVCSGHARSRNKFSQLADHAWRKRLTTLTQTAVTSFVTSVSPERKQGSITVGCKKWFARRQRLRSAVVDQGATFLCRLGHLCRCLRRPALRSKINRMFAAARMQTPTRNSAPQACLHITKARNLQDHGYPFWGTEIGELATSGAHHRFAADAGDRTACLFSCSKLMRLLRSSLPLQRLAGALSSLCKQAGQS